MYNILLTDDEQIVIDSLSFIIEKNFPEQCNIYRASSGGDAIFTCKTNKIDIIFMDINMPGVTGLEAIGEIKKFNPEAVIIILSAFDRFGYAQEALALGAYRYLTKPVNRNLVIQTVRNAMGIIDSVQGKISNDIEIKEKLSFVSSIVESDFIYSSIFNEDTDCKELNKYLEYFKIKLDCFFYCVINLSVIESDHKFDNYSKIRDILISCTECIIGPFMSNKVVVFIPLDNCHDDMQMALILQQDLVRSIFTKLAMHVSARIKIGAGSIESDIKQTIKSYNSALRILDVIEGDGGIAFTNAAPENMKEFSTDISLYEQKLLSRICTGDIAESKSQCLLWLSALFAKYKELNTIRSSVFRILVNARSCVNEVKKGYSEQSVFDNTFGILCECNSFEDFKTYVISQISECSSVIYEIKCHKENPVIAKAKEYIDAHINEELSLDQTADAVNVNPFYLSKLFKDETGNNFIDYVTDKRLDKARSLLKQGELNIKEISHECGYSDQNYFSKLFRRKFGLTPTEYKNGL